MTRPWFSGFTRTRCASGQGHYNPGVANIRDDLVPDPGFYGVLYDDEPGQDHALRPHGGDHSRTAPYTRSVIDPLLPGADLVARGLSDLARTIESPEALLVSIGAPRLRRVGFDVPAPFPFPERRLYELLARSDPDSAHSRYNALIRRLVSFERAAECASR
jgi:hypothetical protein